MRIEHTFDEKGKSVQEIMECIVAVKIKIKGYNY